MRTLTGAVLAAAGVVTGFVAPALSSKHPGYAIPAIAAFALCVIGGTAVLYPRKHLKFAEKLGSYADWVNDHGKDARAGDIFTLGLARNLEASRDENRNTVDRVADLAAGVCIAFGLEVVLWIVGLVLAG
jgi:hypothetical protein